MSENQENQDINSLYGFFNKNIIMLKNIYLEHRLSEGNGILSLFLVKEPSPEVKVGYIKYELLPPELKTDFDERLSRNTTDIIYFYLNTLNTAKMIETDIRDIK